MDDEPMVVIPAALHDEIVAGLLAEIERLRASISPGFIRARQGVRPPVIKMRPAPLDVSSEQAPHG